MSSNRWLSLIITASNTQASPYPLLHYIVGEFDNRIVSSCVLVLIPNLTRGARSCGLIEHVVTHADFRKRGFAAAVLQYALQLAWKANCYKVMLLTGSKEESTFRFYEGAGFKRGIKTGFIAYPPGEGHQNRLSQEEVRGHWRQEVSLVFVG